MLIRVAGGEMLSAESEDSVGQEAVLSLVVSQPYTT